MPRNDRTPNRWLLTAAAATALGVTAAAFAEDVFVKTPTATLRSGKGGAYSEITRAPRGQMLKVVTREGGYLKVRAADGKEGWLHQNNVASSATSGGVDLRPVAGKGADAATDAAAGKGGIESTEWANANNMNQAGLNRMRELRAQVTGPEWEQFMKEGNVGPANR
jgi:uncharacterized protein YgiM (DUF1202 family)